MQKMKQQTERFNLSPEKNGRSRHYFKPAPVFKREDNNLPSKTENKTLRRKIRILEKSIEYGLRAEKDYSNLTAKKYHGLRKQCKFNDTDSDIFFELCEAVKSNRLITYLSEEKEIDGGENIEPDTQSEEPYHQ